MCQSKAEGGRRCAFHLEQGVSRGMLTYSASVTGLPAQEAKAAYEDLEREGLTAPDPTREEVDAFIEEQMFRVRHEPNLTPARRESVLNRLRAALGRILPSGATFHAWKNLVAESWSRVRRKAAAAFVVSALAFGVGACGNAPATAVHDAPDTAAPVSSTQAHTGPAETQQTGSAYAIEKPVIDNSARVYPDAQIQQAYDTVNELTTQFTFNADLMRSEAGHHRTAADFAPMERFMTPKVAHEFDQTTQRALKKCAPSADFNSLQLMAFHDVSAPGISTRATGPVARDMRISNASISLDAASKALKVKETVSGEVLLVKDGQNVKQSVTKTITFWMVPAQGGHGWKIDGWRGTYTGGQVTPDRS